MDQVFRALADPSRRLLLDNLNARNGQSLREMCAGLDMARQSVSKHLAVLESAELVTTEWRGREKLHFLNPAPITAIADRWINQYDRESVHVADGPPVGPEFSYTTYVNAAPESVWRALTEPAVIRRYWSGVVSPADWPSAVLVARPPGLLSCAWHRWQPGQAARFGWTQEQFAEALREAGSRVSFAIEPGGAGIRAVRLTVTHDGFADADSMMYRAVSGRLAGCGGWPELLANLKTLLETGEPCPRPS